MEFSRISRRRQPEVRRNVLDLRSKTAVHARKQKRQLAAGEQGFGGKEDLILAMPAGACADDLASEREARLIWIDDHEPQAACLRRAVPATLGELLQQRLSRVGRNDYRSRESNCGQPRHPRGGARTDGAQDDMRID